MNVTRQAAQRRWSAITAMTLSLGGLMLIPSSCGNGTDRDDATSGADSSVEVVEEQPSTTPASTDEPASLDEQLIDAVRAGHLETVQALLDAGADVDATGSARSGSWTYNAAPAITHAVLRDHTDILEILIGSGADLDKPELGYLDTALHTAAHLDNAAIVHMLIEHGADPQPISRHRNWETPLHYAAEVGAVEAINALLDEGVDVDVHVEGRRTALMNVVKDGGARVATEVGTVLLERGADPNLQEPDGTTALHSAAERGLTDVVLLCIAHGAQIDLQDRLGDTALHLATREDQAEVVAVLVDAGASLDVANLDGQTAVDLAVTDETADLFRDVDDMS